LSGSHNAQELIMSLLNPRRDYLQDMENRGNEAVARFHAQQANIEQTRQRSIEDLKRLAIEKAITIERLEWTSSLAGPRLDDPSFKRKVQDTAAALLFQSHMHLSV
jgi:hypothetical protein